MGMQATPNFRNARPKPEAMTSSQLVGIQRTRSIKSTSLPATERPSCETAKPAGQSKLTVIKHEPDWDNYSPTGVKARGSKQQTIEDRAHVVPLYVQDQDPTYTSLLPQDPAVQGTSASGHQ